ncbi:MAG: glycosyl hydrolase family 65 protein [Candidatus Omnitrophota bacterium]
MDQAYPWRLIYKQFEPEEEGLRESLCTLGNGYLATRGAATEAAPTEVHYPGTYIAGIYNRLGTDIAGRTIFNEDLVNCPNWTYLTFKIRDGGWFSPSATRILSFHQELDMRNGVFIRKILCQTPHGRRTWVHETRIVHMLNYHLAAIKYEIIPDNYSDYISVRSMLDGAVLNMNVERYRQLNFNHWISHDLGKFSRNGVYLGVKASQSKTEVYQVAKLKVFLSKKEIKPNIEIIRHGKKLIGQEFRLFVKKRQLCQIEKTVSIFTSKDKNIKNPKTEAIKSISKLPRFDGLLITHKQAWEKLWEKFDIEIEGDVFSQQVVRLHIFHLLQTASPHNKDIDAGLPARGLHGEAYRGHVFWDEVFVLPFFSQHMPEISKALLLYRYRRLNKAKEYARDNGYHGAMFPWQSGSSGREETQVMHLNPRSGKWGPDYSRNQRHVSFSVVYNVWNYWKNTKDIVFYEKFGAEMILSVAQFASSLAEYDPKDRRFHVRGVMGPDEFHEKFPGLGQTGLIDNAYTNIMVVWTLLKAAESLCLISDKEKKRLLKKLNISQEELERWDLISKKMNIDMDSNGIISQFKGYFKLKELDWAQYRKKYKNIRRMDRILKAEGKSPDNFKVAKQADVLMIFYLLRFEEIKDILKRLGYDCDKHLLKKNYDYYVQRTSHGSTLSKVVHCFVSHLIGKPKIFWDWFCEVLKSDIFDTQGGTTPEGIHCGVMGGSVDIVVRSFAGIQLKDDGIHISPSLPQKWLRIRLKIQYQQSLLSFDINKNMVNIKTVMPKNSREKIPVNVYSKRYFLCAGETLSIPISK